MELSMGQPEKSGGVQGCSKRSIGRRAVRFSALCIILEARLPERTVVSFPPTRHPSTYADELLDAYLFSRTRTRYTSTMSLAESSSREPAATRPGTRANLW